MVSALSTSSQAQVLEMYTVLHALRADWRGALILNVGFDVRGAAVSMAAGVAGGVCLTLDRSEERLRAGLRRGACDFVVNTLDEALRTMKNEIRKGVPLSVGLTADPEAALGEIVERGVAPQLVCGLDGFPEQAARLQSWGALRLSGGGTSDGHSVAGVLERVLAERNWRMQAFALGSSGAIRQFDEGLLRVLPPWDHVRRGWIGSAARMFPRERMRVAWMTPEEAEVLQGAHQARATE